MRRLALALLALTTLAAPAFAENIKADARTSLLLRRPEFEQVVMSPNGELLAIARRGPKGTFVTINRAADLSAVRTIDPGRDGEIDTLRWLDDARLIEFRA